MQPYANYNLLYNFINKVESIDYEKKGHEIEKEIDNILDKLYNDVEDYNKK